ncbi:hypothetical protein OK016_18975 [Vibrio chagasii]|nr:hypothetical protein [Vibrio chagasii]
MEGMQPLAVIEERFDIKFPSTKQLFVLALEMNQGFTSGLISSVGALLARRLSG